MFFFISNYYLEFIQQSCLILTGNLKHKDLTGQVVSSQAYVDDQDYYDTLDSTEAANENTPISAGSEDDGEAE